MYTEKRTVKVIIIAFIILMIGCGISDWSQGQDYQWALNSMLSFFIVGLVSLFGGLLNLTHKG
jgi:DNA-binding transcriptional regulator of glucitol operon